MTLLSLVKLRELLYIKYHYGGMPICKSAFLFVHAIGSRRLKNLISHYNENGLSV